MSHNYGSIWLRRCQKGVQELKESIFVFGVKYGRVEQLIQFLKEIRILSKIKGRLSQ